jgi:hypothetical protein
MNNNFNIWYESFDESFLYINERSNIKGDWLDYSEILKTEYKESIIKPVNKYFYKLCPPPKLISINNNTVTLCQENFAEIFLLKKPDSNKLIAMEKIHMRQFYLSNKTNTNNNLCFNEIFRWAMPWFIDYPELNINIIPIDNSPFYFYEEQYYYQKQISNRIDTKMLFFQFKKEGSHMIDSEYGRIKRQQPAYLINFTGNDILVNKIKEFYGGN